MTAADSAPGYFSHARTEIEPLLPPAPSRVIEIGCGDGSTMAWLKSVRSPNYTAAVELVPAAAERARAVFDEVEVSSVDTASFAFREPRFDLALALDVLEHLAAPDQMVRRLHTMLEPGGVVIASLPNIAHFSVSWPLLWRGRWDYQAEGLLDRTHMRFFTEPTIRALFTENGFTNIEIRRNWLYPNIFALFGLRDQRWRWYSEKLLRPWLRFPRHLFVVQVLLSAQRAPDERPTPPT